MDRYAVVGNPIAHSKSPLIHARFAAQTGESISYDRLLAPLDDFPATVERFRDTGGRGLNVTRPFKQQAAAFAAELGPEAARAGAVNTLSLREDGSARGDNTDGIGLVRDLRENLGLVLTGGRLLLLGAGGAARGVLAPLLEQRPTTVYLANRTAARAEQLARDFSDLGEIEGGGFDGLAGRRFDAIVNATSAGLQGELPPLPAGVLAADGWAYDMLYSDEPTPFVCWARAQGAAAAADGLGMLVEQAAESFFIWRGLRPDTAPVIAALRQDVVS